MLMINKLAGFTDIKFFLGFLFINFTIISLFTGWLSSDLFDKRKEKEQETTYDDSEEDIFLSADPTVRVAHETLQYMRLGLNEVTARKTAEIIQKICEIPAIAITDREKVLAYLGAGCENHKPGDRILTEATKYVIATGEHKIVNSTEELNCTKTDCDCPLSAGVIAPLKLREEVVGSLKLYQTKDGQLAPNIVRLTIGIAQLLSMQMELAELDRQRQLVTEARLDALHAQINPHFLFNTLNTIIMYIRKDPDKSRELLIRLADFFRKTLNRRGHFITLKEELDCVRTYFALEKARFGDKIRLIEDINPELLEYPIPVFSIQPLVENAIKHGITPKNGNGTITIRAKQKGNDLHLSIIDTGVGIPPNKLDKVLQPGYGSGNGVGLSNVHLRLQSLYGEDRGLKIVSSEGKGTAIHMYIPLKEKEIQKASSFS
ncbi:MAG: histidine kinase [Clostridia bacterium]|nr:histidine kinase [Clostridia bacterium]